ncbi:MAG: hypothetical protein QMD12_02240 [Candidatus Aenigmarchaeota archaeon]|nr:hypothetical protein [Candidatus Aenigmarchaeota archaeon]
MEEGRVEINARELSRKSSNKKRKEKRRVEKRRAKIILKDKYLMDKEYLCTWENWKRNWRIQS